MCTVGQICNRCTGFVAMTAHTLLIVLYTANAYSCECEMSPSACACSMAGFCVVALEDLVWLVILLITRKMRA